MWLGQVLVFIHIQDHYQTLQRVVHPTPCHSPVYKPLSFMPTLQNKSVHSKYIHLSDISGALHLKILLEM